jgi:MerR family mercuric resistance operon transcriptional regulator
VGTVAALSIGQVAKQAGIGVETVRFYEREGLLEEPPRRPGGYRAYPPEVVPRLRFIRRAKDLGFSLREIAEMLSLRVNPRATCGDVLRLAEEKIAAVEAKIADLQRIGAALRELAGACTGAGPASACPFLEYLDRLEG